MQDLMPQTAVKVAIDNFRKMVGEAKDRVKPAGAQGSKSNLSVPVP